MPLGTGTVNLHDCDELGRPSVTVADSCGGPSAISRDGMLVAYERYCGAYGSELRLVSVQGTGVPASRLLYRECGRFGDYADGRLAGQDVDRGHAGPQGRSSQIGLVTTADGSLRGTEVRGLEGHHADLLFPDGRDLAYDLPASDTSHQRDVFVLAVDGSREIPLVVHPANDVVMGWSPDGKHLLFASGRRGGVMSLWSLAIANGKRARNARIDHEKHQ